MAASAITTNRFTAKPCAVSKEPNAETSADKARGWEVCAMLATMADRLPDLPCQ